jgi:hypothetical protein
MKKSTTSRAFGRQFKTNITRIQNFFRTAALVASGLVLVNSAQSQVNKLVNPGFEEGATGWTTTGNQTYNNHPVVTLGATYDNSTNGECAQDPTAEPVNIYDGTNVGNIFGPFFSNPSTAAWVQSGIPAAPGSTWSASGWAYASHEDLSGPNQYHYEVDFYNASGTLLAAYQSYVVENLTCGETTPFPLDTWVDLSVTNEMTVTGGANTGTVASTLPSGVMTAPAGTASVTFQAVFVNINYAGGSMYLDDCALNFLSGPQPPSLAAIPINGLTQCTNQVLNTTATAASGNTISSFEVISTTTPFGSKISTTTTNTYSVNSSVVSGLGTATAVLNYPLTTNEIYTVSVVATDNAGNIASANAHFDTIQPALVIEATDFNFSSGGFLNTPANGGYFLYTNQMGTETVDEHKNPGNVSTTIPYRSPSEEAIINYAYPDTLSEQKYAVPGGGAELCVNYTSSFDWFNFTRTYGPTGSAPAGNYNIYLYMGTSGSGPQARLGLISGDPTSSTQSSNVLGTFGTASFTENDWAGYNYVPLSDQFGNLISVTIPSGVQTLNLAQIANPNLGFLMLMPATQILTPGLLYDYPNGLQPFESTNHLQFTVGPNNGSNIISSGIHLVLNGVDVTSGLTLTQSGNQWTGSYPVESNAVYAAVINVTNSAGLYSSFVDNFDTFNINNYQWEAVDYDFSTNNGSEWIGGLFIDNPVPTCDITAPQEGELEANSYFAYPTGFTPAVDPNSDGAVAQQGVDMNFPNDGQGIGSEYYRADGVGSQPANDYVRPKFVAAQQEFNDPNIGPINIGYYGTGYWLNYTRHYPTNNYYVWGRLASGSAYSGTSLAVVTSGAGTSTQTTNIVGTFSDPNASGYQAWHWIPLLNGNGQQVSLALGGKETLRVTSTGLNTEFFMLVPAPLTGFVVTPTIVSGQLNLSFPTASGYTYYVQYKSSLTGTWTAVGSSTTGDGNTHTVTESLSGTQGYYQVVAEQ